MGKLGFYCFTSPTPVVEPTIKEKIALLTADQKTAILNGFINMVPAPHLDHQLCIPIDIVEAIYQGISDIQDKAKAYMRGEVIITPAVTHIDPVTGLVVIDTPAVMNTPPTTQAALGTLLQPSFVDIFTAGQVTGIITAMVKWSKYDGTGIFSFYQSKIIL